MKKMTTVMVVFLLGLAALPCVAEEHSTSTTLHNTPTFSFEGGAGYAETLFSLPVYSRVGVSGAMYRAMESSVGYFGPEMLAVKTRKFTFAPGAGLLFGQGEPKPGGAAARLRMKYEDERITGDFSGIQGLSSFEHSRDSYIVASLGFKFGCRLEESCRLGPTGEHLGHRKGHEKETEDLVGLGGAVPMPKIPHFPRFELSGKVLIPVEGKVLQHRGFRLGFEFKH